MPVAAKLKSIDKQLSVIAVTDKGGSFNDILDSSKDIDKVIRISGGKYRRYPNQSKLLSLFDVKTHALNARDSFRTIKGLSQANKLIKQTSPSVIFIKGGYVSVPVGLAAKMAGIPYVTHDSDAVPSLSTKIIGKSAIKKLSGMPISGKNEQEFIHVGVPVSDKFIKISTSRQNELKKELGISEDTKMVLVTGGSQGAQRINSAIEKILPDLAKDKVLTVHQTGKKFQKTNSDLYRSITYIDEMYKYSGAADIIVSRAGSSLAEFAQQIKPVIAIPAKHLAGGHQILNAKILEKNNAAIVLGEDELDQSPSILLKTIRDLLSNRAKANSLAKAAERVYPSNSAERIATELMNILNKS